MRAGLASPHEIAKACGIGADLVRNWRARAGILTDEARVEHVRRLMERQPKPVPVIDEPDAAPF
jgi:hypothetical protein